MASLALEWFILESEELTQVLAESSSMYRPILSLFYSLPLVLFAGPLSADGSLLNAEECLATETVLQSVQTEEDTSIVYREDNPGSPSSDVTFEFWQGDQRLWDAQGERRCTMGVSRCYLRLPYLLDGEGGRFIESEMNSVELPDGTDLVVFSHLSAQIVYLYAKSETSRDVSLVGKSYDGTEYPRKADMILPTSFWNAPCADAAN